MDTKSVGIAAAPPFKPHALSIPELFTVRMLLKISIGSDDVKYTHIHLTMHSIHWYKI